jgi:mannosyl-oligosaccharide glucosidase
VWRPAIANDVLAHWMHLMHSDGWIPREQILGAEAQARVPAEFMPQHRQHANPPTLMLRLERLLNGGAEQGGEEEWLPLARRLWPRLTRWYGWLVRTQAGELPHTFRWRGRDAADNRLNALTLSSGLDDYPRATVPTMKTPNPEPNRSPSPSPNPSPSPSPSLSPSEVFTAAH